MKRKYIITFLLIFSMLISIGLAKSESDLFEKVKLDLFDKEWDDALKGLEALISDFPDSSHYSQFVFYKSKCLEEKKLLKQALASYQLYLEVSDNKILKEEASISIIDLNFLLYNKGDSSYLKKIYKFLRSNQPMVRYYVALRLSSLKDKKAARKAVPTLNRMISQEDDDELVNRAKIALMKIDPRYLEEISVRTNVETSSLYIRVYDKKLKKDTFSITIPFLLAKLALDALPDKEKGTLSKKGYNLDRILQSLIKTGEIFRLEEDDSIIRIWIK
jgi:hypothetical protein